MSTSRIDPDQLRALRNRISDVRDTLKLHPVVQPPADTTFASPAIQSAFGEFREAARQRLDDSCLYCEETEEALSSLADNAATDDQVAAATLRSHNFDTFQKGRTQDTGRG
jgi:hypothetical protein